MQDEESLEHRSEEQPLPIGEVYFVQEFPNPNKEPTKLVKIGLAREEGGSEERLKQHQTGNPRQLKLRHVVLTPAPEWLEGTLHSRLSAHRVRREWFSFEPAELESAVQLAEALAVESFQYEPLFEAAEALGSEVSTEPKRPQTVEAQGWFDRLSQAKVRLDLCSDLKDLYKSTFESLGDDMKQAIEMEDLIVTEYAVNKKFDESAFSLKYPELFRTYQVSIERMTRSFLPSYKQFDVAEIDVPIHSLANDFKTICDQVKQGKVSFSDELTVAFSEVERFAAIYSWDRKIADASLRVLCGKAGGIEGICSWNRSKKIVTSLDTDLLETQHPTEFNEFVTVTTSSKTKVSKRPRRKI